MDEMIEQFYEEKIGYFRIVSYDTFNELTIRAFNGEGSYQESKYSQSSYSESHTNMHENMIDKREKYISIE